MRSTLSDTRHVVHTHTQAFSLLGLALCCSGFLQMCFRFRAVAVLDVDDLEPAQVAFDPVSVTQEVLPLAVQGAFVAGACIAGDGAT